MRITLIYPNVTVEGFAKGGVKPKTGWIHHGLCYISAALKKNGHDVLLVNLSQLSGWEELPGIIESMMPDIVGITMMSVDFDAAVKSARVVKKVRSAIKVLVGGAHPTIMATELADNPHIDYIFKGEAEKTLPEILDDILKGNVSNKVIQGETPNLDEIPRVDRSLFKILEAPIAPFLKMPHITAIAGRGCTYNCSFCQPAEKIMFGSRTRRMSAERFLVELRDVEKNRGFNSLMIHDDCLVEDEEWVRAFLSGYGKKTFRKPFVCQSRADIIVRNPRLFKDMRKHGLEMLLIGFESGSQRILNFLRKGT
ncbi:MAG: B12-binding domain-containing radical SAM protein, partial [Omnitrophica bacterium]|nr:B12-binding domain-containing radical SAM protein [Candidatus Omnitrophota bacterium]